MSDELEQEVLQRAEEASSEEHSSSRSANHQPNCRLCKWSLSNVEYYKFFESRALEGMPFNRMSSQFIEWMKSKTADEKAPSRKSIRMHFLNHVGYDLKQVIEAERRRKGTDAPISATQLIDINKISQVTKEEFDEYEELCKLYKEFDDVTKKIYEYEESLKAQGVSGVNVWSQAKIQTYTSMMNTKKAVLSEIAKMRQGEKLVSVAAKFIIETYAKSIISKMREEFDAFTAVMRRSGAEEDLINAFESMAAERLGHMLVSEAESAMNITKKQYKLPN